MQDRFHVIVVGGGHAGVEAAWAAANLLAARHDRQNTAPPSVALVTLDAQRIGEMSCNPANGGLAKGQLVREIDALGGIMGLATDATGIQFKVLNASKGLAVQGPRAQCDRHAYARAIRDMLASRNDIRIVQASVERLLVEAGRIAGVQLQPSPAPPDPCARHEQQKPESSGATLVSGSLTLLADAVVLTTGTFMRGLMHTGDERTPGGRHGEAAASAISRSLQELGFELGRLKTGTPPRLARASIDWQDLEPMLGDDPPTPMSDLTAAGAWSVGNLQLRAFPRLAQVDCRSTRTTAQAHEAIRANLHRAPMFNGQIKTAGPRYCPSIEDKVVRFAERPSHGVFLEPEGLETDWVYCNGIATSLPADVQDTIVRSMPGCARAHILRYGYAVEYDMVPPHQIEASAMTRRVRGLFLAGQINGTSGYEEAAAQGLVAGANAALCAVAWKHADPDTAAGAHDRPLVLGRDEAYIGVLMDDLVTRTPTEPYRMFTSRAEHRLLLRADNSADRLTQRAIDLGLLGGHGLGLHRCELYEKRRRHLDELRALVARAKVASEPISLAIRRDPSPSVALLTSLLEKSRSTLEADPPHSVLLTMLAEIIYEPYVQRQQAEIRRGAEMEHRSIPQHADFASMTALRSETRQALLRFRPRTFGQAARLEGMTPADLTLLSVLLRAAAR